MIRAQGQSIDPALPAIIASALRATSALMTGSAEQPQVRRVVAATAGALDEVVDGGGVGTATGTGEPITLANELPQPFPFR
jgi:hypothetical protein